MEKIEDERHPQSAVLDPLGYESIPAAAAAPAISAAAAAAPPPTATATAAVATAATAAAATVTAAARAVFLGLGFVNRQRAAVVLLAVQGADGGLCFLVRSHLDEPESLAAPGGAVGDYLGRLHG